MSLKQTKGQNVTDLKKLVTKSAVRVVPVSILNVDPKYQRDVKPAHKKIISDFDHSAFGIPYIGEREDCTLWIVDGLQRITAVSKMGWKEVKVSVFSSKGTEHEARVFDLVNMHRTKLRSYEEFRALLAANDETALKIKETVELCGFTVTDGRNGDYKKLRCVNTLKYMMIHHKENGIRFALTTVKEAWPEDMLGIYNDMLLGLSIFYSKYGGDLVNRDKLITNLKTVTPQKILYKAKQASMSDRIAGDVAEEINRIYKKRGHVTKGF